jgi:hypothetical protein
MRGHAGGSHLGALGRITPYLSSGMNPARLVFYDIPILVWNKVSKNSYP